MWRGAGSFFVVALFAFLRKQLTQTSIHALQFPQYPIENDFLVCINSYYLDHPLSSLSHSISQTFPLNFLPTQLSPPRWRNPNNPNNPNNPPVATTSISTSPRTLTSIWVSFIASWCFWWASLQSWARAQSVAGSRCVSLSLAASINHYHLVGGIPSPTSCSRWCWLRWRTTSTLITTPFGTFLASVRIEVPYKPFTTSNRTLG